jgi:ATP-binding cassette subfamily C protein
MLQVYDRVVSTRGTSTLLFLTLIFLFAIGTLSLLDLVRSRLLVRASTRLDKRLSGALLNAQLSGGSGGRRAAARQAVREFDSLRQTLTGTGILALFDAPWTPIYVLVCFMINWSLGLLALVGGLSLVAVTALNERATRARLQKANEAANLAYVGQEYSVAGADVIRALGMRSDTVARRLDERKTAAKLQTEASFAAGGYVALSRFLRLALQSMALGLGAWLAIEQKISAGAIFAASLLVARSLSPIEQVLGAWKDVVKARGAWRTLVELLGRTENQPERTRMPAPAGGVEIERLWIGAPGRESPILADVSFATTPGEILGIVGPSGGGKTTLLRAVAGASGFDRGAIRFDGASQADWDPEKLGRHIGFVPQEATLFAGTVKENIARFRTAEGEDQASIDAQVIEAARLCGAHDMIVRLPQGYDTRLEFGGRGLSAGQAQRVALARALFGDPKILVLDEPNAHLDAEGELALMRALTAFKEKGATVLIAAHRPGVLQVVDRLMVLQDGQVKHLGPRDEILRQMQPQRPTVVAPARDRFAAAS